MNTTTDSGQRTAQPGADSGQRKTVTTGLDSWRNCTGWNAIVDPPIIGACTDCEQVRDYCASCPDNPTTNNNNGQPGPLPDRSRLRTADPGADSGQRTADSGQPGALPGNTQQQQRRTV